MTRIEAARDGVVTPERIRVVVRPTVTARFIRSRRAGRLLALAMAIGVPACDRAGKSPAQSSSPAAEAAGHDEKSERDTPMLDLPKAGDFDVRLARTDVRELHGAELVMRIDEHILSGTSSGDDKEDFLRLTRGQRIVLVVQGFEGEVNNGGLDQYFFNSSGDFAPEALVALREVGVPHFANILADAMALFPNGTPPRDRAARQDALATLDEDQLDKLDERFYAAYRKEEEIAFALEQYMTAHPTDFFRD